MWCKWYKTKFQSCLGARINQACISVGSVGVFVRCSIPVNFAAGSLRTVPSYTRRRANSQPGLSAYRVVSCRHTRQEILPLLKLWNGSRSADVF